MKKIFLMLAVAGLFAACQTEKKEGLSQVNQKDFQSEINGKKVDLYTLKNANGMEMTVTNFGAHVVELFAPDRDGKFADVVLGHDKLDEYVNFEGERFLGATIGRVGNRIANGKFTLDGVEYTLDQNNGTNCLHGGNNSLDMVVWDAVQENPQKLVLTYHSPDMECGFPGNLDITMTYELTDQNEFVVTHEATTDKKTPVNLTHHSFFNLHGNCEGDINDHVLTLAASKFTPIDSVMIPTGVLQDVEGTPMDFRTPTAIGERVDADFEQLKLARGYDHNWVLDKGQTAEPELAATVYDPVSGRVMEVLTTEPGIQFYGGNFMDGSSIGKKGVKHNFRASLALETQHYPDTPNQPNFPTINLEPGQKYHHVCIYKFSAK
ncbi:MAG: galactose mutarotase [Prevotella sp.]|nr:galactose mutarotase [Prevotella sp.]